SKKLADSKLLDGLFGKTILWGGMGASKALDPDLGKTLTELDPRVWRALYLSVFMYPGAHSITRKEGYSVLQMDCAFRNELDPGDYPYPFWHSAGKWRSYQLAKGVMILFQNGKIVAAYRSPEEDPARPLIDRKLAPDFHWTPEDVAHQRVSLYTHLF